MPSSSPMVVVLAAVAGAMAAWVGVIVMALWNKLDKRLDDLEARQAKRTDELRADNKALGEKIDRLVEIFATVKPA